MKAILELDIGNSRIKWRLLPAGGAAAAAGGAAESASDLQRQLVDCPVVKERDKEGVLLARACSVQGEEATAAIAQVVRRCVGQSLQLAQVSRCCAGVSNQYADLRRLGPDRWLAMLAGFNEAAGSHQAGGCVVVDAGTALTVDVVDATGLHRGGYIVPGQALMQYSLVANTGIRLSDGEAGGASTADTREAADAPLGISTDGAVRGGCLAAALALIERVVLSSPMPQTGEQPLSLFITGGDGPLLQQGLIAAGRLSDTCQIRLAPDLVLDGLALALPATHAAATKAS